MNQTRPARARTVVFLSYCATMLAASTALARPVPAQIANTAPAVSVDPGGRHLVDAAGKPFFWLADTAWMLFQVTDRKEAELYLSTRARQGFTVIQATFIQGESRVAGTGLPNTFGDTAFIDMDPARPNITPGNRPEDAAEYDYWDHVDYVVDTAAKYGLVIAGLPDFVGYNGDGYQHLTSKNAAAYGKFLGERYRSSKNMIWVLGGDHEPMTNEHRSVWDLMARAITTSVAGAEDYTKTLMTYHIRGGHSSSEYWQKAPWIDFNMLQVWEKVLDINEMVSKDYGLDPIKPVIMSEGAYEDGPQYASGPIDAYMIRRQAYWSYFSGSHHTYGNTNVWNFGTFKPEGTQDWKKALLSPGAKNLSVAKKFLTSIPWWNLEPSQKSLKKRGAIGSSNRTHLAMRARDGSGLLAYISLPDRVTFDLDSLTVRKPLRATWIDPRTGRTLPAGDQPSKGERTFGTPKGWQDALLMIDTGFTDDARPAP